MPLTILMYGDCTSYNGRIRENVTYIAVGLYMYCKYSTYSTVHGKGNGEPLSAKG